jgi:hypothetical protein
LWAVSRYVAARAWGGGPRPSAADDHQQHAHQVIVVVAEVCPVAKTRVADTISLDGGPSRALGATVEGPDPTGSRQDQSGGPECRPVNPREGGEPSEPARRAPQQPAISPAKKIRPDRCGTATLSLSLSLQTLQSRRVSGSTDSLADATRTAAITGGRRQAKIGRLPPGGPSRIPPALLDRLSKSSARGPSAVTSSLLAIRAGRGAPRPTSSRCTTLWSSPCSACSRSSSDRVHVRVQEAH